ncbi:MAG: hypothetical protein H6978_06035 [Gammaproteobacteria bacterium]|nr:hypothetical protein [Gammaproteobacteria bacterium]
MDMFMPIPRFTGYRDSSGRVVPFETADEVFSRARMMGTRVLLRLTLSENDQLEGMLYTNDSSLAASSRSYASAR